MRGFMQIKYYQKWFAFIMSILLLAVFCFIAPAKIYAEQKEKTVLILNSYHRGFVWTDHETQGILDSFVGSGIKPEIYIEYMDWKRYSEENTSYLVNYYGSKYKGKNIDVIITTDDAAFEFALKNRGTIFCSVPVVFCGVSEESLPAISKGYSDYTGVIEGADMQKAAHTLLKLMPEVSSIYVVFDQTESGKSMGQKAVETFKHIRNDLEIMPITGLSLKEIEKEGKRFKRNSAVLITAYNVDRLGIFVPTEDFCKMLSQASTVPVFHLYEIGVGTGAVGGMVISGKMQGEKAGDIAIKIVRGKNVNEIPIVKTGTSLPVFDYLQLSRFKIPMEFLPTGSLVMNKPFSFLKTYKNYVLLVSVIFILLVGLNLIFFIYNRRILKMKKELQVNHEELTQVYEELSASEEELRQQFDELSCLQENLRESEERNRLLVEATNDAIFDYDLKNEINHYSGRWLSLTGYTADELSSMDIKQLVIEEDYRAVENAVREHIAQKTEYFNCEYRLKTKHEGLKWLMLRGTTVMNSYNSIDRVVAASIDIDKLKRTQEKLKKMAFTDITTGIPNKLALKERFKKYANQPIKDLKCAVFFIDIDNLKIINDTMGHEFGDSFLKKTAERLTKATESQGELYRVGGDEFVMLFTCEGIEKARKLADTVLHLFAEPLAIDGSIVNASLSFGISIYPDNGETYEKNLMNADIAMYEAKKCGKARYVFYQPQMNYNLRERNEIEKSLACALQKNEFETYFQPQYDLKTKKICGYEALLRWNSPALGSVSPLKFIQIAEETRYIIPIGKWVMDKAVDFIKKVHLKGYTHCTISVNVSVVQLLQDDFVDMVNEILIKYNLSPEFLELEITESVLMESYEVIKEKLEDLKNQGVKVALDDFGQGYSSLGYLQQLPISTLKIDRTFIKNISMIKKSRAMVDCIVMMGHKLGLVTVAEGVEAEEQLSYLVKKRCDRIQGFIFSQPVPSEEAMELLIRDSTMHNSGV